MEKRPLVRSENYDIRMQCHLCNSFESVGLYHLHICSDCLYSQHTKYVVDIVYNVCVSICV